MNRKKWMALSLSAVLSAGMLTAPVNAFAATEATAIASESDTAKTRGKTYVSLGADLTDAQRATVLKLIGISEENLKTYKVVTITNKEEHAAYDKYLSKKVIGSRALSCAKVEEQGDGYGIHVETHNISYCTTEMYQNALVTAGMKNANVTVAGPVNLSGTAALLGVTKAYSELTGTSLKAEAIDAAAQELVVTSKIGQETGDKEKAAELVASVKEQVAAGNLDPKKVNSVIDEASEQLGIKLTDEQKSQLSELMNKIDGLDLDVNTLKSQVGKLYDKLAEKGIDLQVTKEKALNFFEKFINWCKSIWNQIFH